RQEDRVYGDPDAFFRRLEPSELDHYGAILGGIATQEQTYDMPRTRKVLLDTLAARGVEIRTSTQVTSLQRQGMGYRVTHKNTNDGSTETEHFDTVVNAAGYGARGLSQEFGDLSGINLQLKLFSNVSVDGETQARYPSPFFVMPGFMHWVPQEGHGSSVSGFYSEILDNVFVSQGERLVIPAYWEETLNHGVPLDYEGRASAIVDQARRYFMPELNNNTQPIEMYPGVAVSFSPDRTNKTQEKPRLLTRYPGFYTEIPSKAANAVSLGLDIVNMVLDESQRKGTIPDRSEYVEGVRLGRNVAYIDA
ncbi:MAG TPA: FAD-dependent oxidoreductase, partial [Candidatus Saccharimonadales bacterium]|nr:FAD-dependent oxidoreductase [Candidatus Saccharimonadales bacterium]